MSTQKAEDDSMEEGEIEDGEIEEEGTVAEVRQVTFCGVSSRGMQGQPSQVHTFSERRRRKFNPSDQIRAPRGGYWIGTNRLRGVGQRAYEHTSPGVRLLRGRGKGPGRGQGTGTGRGRGRFQSGNRNMRGRGVNKRGAYRGSTKPLPVQDTNYQQYPSTDEEINRAIQENKNTFEELLKEHRAIQAKLEALNAEEVRTKAILLKNPVVDVDQKTEELNKETEFITKDLPVDKAVKAQRSRRRRSRSGSQVKVKAKTSSPPEAKPETIEDEDDEMSELQLRLIALASATKKVISKAEEEEIERKELEEEIGASEESNVEEKVTEVISPTKKAEKSKRLSRKERSRRLRKKIHSHKKHEVEKKRKEAAEIRNLENEDEQFSRFLKFVGKDENEIESRREAGKIRTLGDEHEQYKRFMKFVKREKRMRKRSSSFHERENSEGTPLRDEQSSLVPFTDNNTEFSYDMDNYEEVEMDVDSSENSSLVSPSPVSFLAVKDSTSSQSLIDAAGEKLDAGNHSNEEKVADDDEDVLALREQLLKSMATKRAFTVPDNTKTAVRRSSPSMSTGIPLQKVMSVPVKSSRNRTIPTPVQLPQHKRVVINLGEDSDSSDSEQTKRSVTSGSAGGLLGDLDMFLKEARKTVDASKGQSQPQLMQPLKTPDAVNRLSADQKEEYRRLKQEIVKRELLRKVDAGKSSASPSPCVSDLETQEETVAKKPSLTEEQKELLKKAEGFESKLLICRKLLQRDKGMLSVLETQKTKKQAVVKAAELKVQKLKEQLQAAMKLLLTSRLELKKVENNEVIIQNKVEKKLTLETKLIGELNTTRIAAGHEPLSIPHIYAMADKERTYKKIQDKTSTTSVAAPRKLTQEEIALEKARLQKLERVFAEKIKKLREIQNRKELTVAASKDSSYGAFQRLAEVKLQSANLKPAMIEYKKDKICFDFGNESDVDESQQSVKTRRKSLIELNPSTKPNLMSPNNEKSKTRIESTDITTDADNKSEITAIGKENKEAGKSRTSKISKKDVFAKKIFSMPSDSQLERLKRLQKEKEQVVKFDPMWVYVGRDNDYINVRKLNLDIPVAETVAKQSVDDGEIVSYKPYKSTLLHFKTYRFNPYYRTKCKLSLSSPSFSNRLNPRRVLCSFDLKGTCNDEKCPWQHSDDYELTTDGLYKDIVSYAPKLAGIDDSTNIADCDKKLTSYIETIKKQKLKIMNTDQLSLWFVSKVNEHYSRVAPHTILFDQRKWKPQDITKKIANKEDGMDSEIKMPEKRLPSKKLDMDSILLEDDTRYFSCDVNSAHDLELAVLQHPTDVQLWIKLAYKQLSGKNSSVECLDRALNVLSRSLESNGSSVELWQHYLTLYSKRVKSEELREMCQEAVQFAPHYDLWWKCLQLEKTFSGKDSLCKKILDFLVKQQEELSCHLQSHQILEVLLYRVHLHVQSRRYNIALNIFNGALSEKVSSTSSHSHYIAKYLTGSDRCLAWLSFIYLTQFHTLPPSLYDPVNNNPGKIVNKEPFILPWTESSELNPEVLLSHFQDALDACSDNDGAPHLNTVVCIPLYKNVLHMETMLARLDAAKTLCRRLLTETPNVVQLWLLLTDLEIKSGNPGEARQVFQEAISVNSSSLELCHIAASFELSQDNAASAISHLVKCVSRLFESHQLPNNPSAIDLYGQVLGQSISVENKLPTVTSDIIAEGQVYLWLNYTLLLELYGDYSGAIEAYETALYVLKNSHDVRKIWMQYLKYQCRRTASSQTMSREQKTFTDLVNRCLITMATQVHPPYSSTFLWSDYSFHNNVISLYLSCVKEDCWSAVYERYLRMMPDNAILALRWCQYEIRVGNLQEAQRICSGCIDVMPCCLPLWKVAILLELKQANYKEVHRMYWKATQALPFAATLWKDFILFEVAYSNRLEDIKEVIEVCQEIGINIEDYVATLLK